MRLSGGSGPFEGRLEINYNGTWGTVCDDNFDTNAAAVVCRMLNFPTQGALQEGSAFFKPGTGQIWLDDIDCNGKETDIALCGHRGWGRTSCDHNEDVSVICAGSSQRQNVIVRLSGGASSSEGRVEVFHNNAWGTVCDDDFDTKAAAVVCRMLGLPSSGAQPRPKAYYGSGNGIIWLDNVRCTGTETSIGYCNANPWGNNDCDHNEDVGVLCDTGTVGLECYECQSSSADSCSLDTKIQCSGLCFYALATSDRQPTTYARGCIIAGPTMVGCDDTLQTKSGISSNQRTCYCIENRCNDKTIDHVNYVSITNIQCYDCRGVQCSSPNIVTCNGACVIAIDIYGTVVKSCESQYYDHEMLSKFTGCIINELNDIRSEEYKCYGDLCNSDARPPCNFTIGVSNVAVKNVSSFTFLFAIVVMFKF